MKLFAAVMPLFVVGFVKKLIKGEKGENAKEEKNFEDILDFHVKFERIHPFQDGNVPLRYQQQIAA